MHTNATQQEILRWTTADEGQFFERKSAIDRSDKRGKSRKTKAIANDIADTVCAMANADGGELIVGVENDGKVSGVTIPSDDIPLLLGVPKNRNYANPPITCRSRHVRTPDRKALLHFEVDWSPDVHQRAGSRYLLRVHDQNSPFPADQIAALKSSKGKCLFERTFPPGAGIDEVNVDLVRKVIGPVWPGLDPIDILRRYGLIAGRNGHSVPTFAALLLFGRDPKLWHPRCGIDFIRWEGTERKQGMELNIAKRIRIEEPLAVLIQKACAEIQPFIRERQQLHDLFFTEKLEYPPFAWQEAVVNAVAHRDYSLQGAPVEVWMYNDRMEIRSPGLPPEPITIEALNRCERVHFSRNPMMVRVLTDIKYMRDVGEGIPRIFDEMDRAGCYPPRFELAGGFIFQITLRNEPIYDRETLEWLRKFESIPLSGDQKRVLAYARTHGNRFTSRDYQKVVRTDIYTASGSIKDMIRKGIVRSIKKGSRVYEVFEPLAATIEMPQELTRLLPVLQRKQGVTNGDLQRSLKVSRGTALRLLKEWVSADWLQFPNKKRGLGSIYKPGGRLLHQSYIASKPSESDAMPPEGGAMQ